MKKLASKIIWLIVILIMAVWVAPFVVDAATSGITPKNAVDLEVGIGGFKKVEKGIAEYIGQVYLFATAIVGGLAVVMIIIGAVQYSSSAGNKAAIGSAKETMTSAIIGLVIVLMAYLILGTISGDFVNLTNPRLNVINIGNTTTRLSGCDWQTGATCPTKTHRQGTPADCGRGDVPFGKICCCRRIDTIPGTCFDWSADRNFCDPENDKRECYKPIGDPYSSLTGCTVNCTNKNPAHFCKESPVSGNTEQNAAYCCYEDITPPPHGVPECPEDTTTGQMFKYHHLCLRNCRSDTCCKPDEISRCKPNDNFEENWCCLK